MCQTSRISYGKRGLLVNEDWKSQTLWTSRLRWTSRMMMITCIAKRHECRILRTIARHPWLMNVCRVNSVLMKSDVERPTRNSRRRQDSPFGLFLYPCPSSKMHIQWKAIVSFVVSAFPFWSSQKTWVVTPRSLDISHSCSMVQFPFAHSLSSLSIDLSLGGEYTAVLYLRLRRVSSQLL